MRRRTYVLFFLFVLTLCLAFAVSSAMATEITGVKFLGDGSMEVRWDGGNDDKLILVRRTGDNFEYDHSTYGYRWFDLEGNGRMTVYWTAPGQSYWITTMNSAEEFDDPWYYDADYAPNFNEWSRPPAFTIFNLKMRNSSGKVSNVDYFTASELEDRSNYNSYGIQFRVTWPNLRNARTYLWQFVLELPDGERLVEHAEIVTMPAGGYWWDCTYEALENWFHIIYDMRREVPVGQYKWSLYWDGQHVATREFMVR